MKYSLLLLTFVTSLCSGQTIRFMAGLEKNMSAAKQSKILQKALPRAQIITYKHTEINRLMSDLRGKQETVILFSAAGRHTLDIVEMTNSHVWVVEPHYSAGKKIRRAISMGLPKTQIILGPKPARGLGIHKKCVSTPNGIGHFGALRFAGSLIKCH